MWTQILLIAVAGALGSVCRWALSMGVARLAGGSFPWATASVNLIGSLAFGIAWGLGQHHWGAQTRVAVLVGFMGAFTTFSSFAFDNYRLGIDGAWGALVANMVGQTLLGLGALTFGIWLVSRTST